MMAAAGRDSAESQWAGGCGDGGRGKDRGWRVDVALSSGAKGARLRGGGLGGCIVALCAAEQTTALVEALSRKFYTPRNMSDPQAEHLIIAEPSGGACVIRL